MARPTIGHLDPEFIKMMDSIGDLLRQAFETKNKLTIPISAPGSAGMEFCFVNLVEPGDKVVVCINGVFGIRMRENVERAGGEAIALEDDWGRPVDHEKLESALQANPDVKVVAFVHAETSTGARSDAGALAAIAKKYNCLTIMDAVTSLGGIPVKLDEWGVDAVYSGTQKCLSCTPGLSPVSLSEAAVKKIESRTTRVQSWFLDANLLMGYWGENAKRSYHHTAPINALYGLHEALVILAEEGLENSFARHKQNHDALKAGLESMGLEFLVEEKYRLPQLNAVGVPTGVDEARIRGRLLNEYNLEIGAGLGAFAGKVWRIGLMGQASTRKNVLIFLGALESILHDEGARIHTGLALPAARRVYGDS